MRRGVVAGVAVVGLAVVGVGGYVGKQTMDDRAACVALTRYLDEEGEAQTVSEGSPRVLVVGDSYTAGDGLEDRSQRWVGHLPGGVTAAGIGYTGFLDGGPCGAQSYADRLPDLLAANEPDVLVIQGGLNDHDESGENVTAAARELLASASGVSRVVVVGPPSAPVWADDVPKVDDALREAAEAAGAEYVSTADVELDYLPDRLHLTAAGHEAFAAVVAGAIR